MIDIEVKLNTKKKIRQNMPRGGCVVGGWVTSWQSSKSVFSSLNRFSVSRSQIPAN